MFHGGTNFALGNGALWKNYTAAFITSYDYGAPLSEDGRTTDLYFTLRDTIQKYTAEAIPEPPANIPHLSIPETTLSPTSSLFDIAATKSVNTAPLSMEALGQDYGFVLYEHTVTQAYNGTLQPGDRARDRVIVYVNRVQTGVIDSTYTEPKTVSLSLAAGDTLQLLVENLGRVDYYSLESGLSNEVLDPYKGIVGNVTVGGSILQDWTSISLPLDTVPSASAQNASSTVQGPTFFSGSFSLGSNYTTAAQLDTFIAVPNGVKGMVWVNGFSLGRYCEFLSGSLLKHSLPTYLSDNQRILTILSIGTVGPQQSLYLPGTILKAGQTNEIVILELEPQGDTLTFRGDSERVWGNNPDPDYS